MTFPRSIRSAAFTLIEVLTVIAIIVVLMGLTVGIAGFARDKGARARAQSEIAALESALERYKIDMGGYPYSKEGGDYETLTDPDDVAEKLRGGSPVNGDLRAASKELYYALSGFDPDDNKYVHKTYFTFPLNMLEGVDDEDFDPEDVTAVIDPWGNPYGYYLPSPRQPNGDPPVAPMAKNPTFDLYSTANSDRKAGELNDDEAVHETWVTNW